MKILLPCCLLLGSLLPACVIDTSSHSEHSGRRFGPETLEQIQPGCTQEFVLALLGDPTTRSSAGGKSEIWKWEYSKREKRQSCLIFVLDSSQSTEVHSTTYVLFEDGKVVKTWQD